MRLSKKVVVVTGGSRGIGHELCQQLTDKGAKVYSIDVIKPKDPVKGVHYLKGSVSDPVHLKKAFAKIKGKIDIIVNNAGVIRRGELFDASHKDFDFLFDVNVKGSWLTIKQALKKLVKKPMLVQMCSYRALQIYKDPALYSLTKRMAMLLAQVIQLTYPKWDVRCVFPGPTDTQMARFGFYGSALKKRERIMHSPEFLVTRIIKLIESDRKWLVYNPKTKSYFVKG